jgi:hypothetical protein
VCLNSNRVIPVSLLLDASINKMASVAARSLTVVRLTKRKIPRSLRERRLKRCQSKVASPSHHVIRKCDPSKVVAGIRVVNIASIKKSDKIRNQISESKRVAAIAIKQISVA